jgi:hypothetical protein
MTPPTRDEIRDFLAEMHASEGLGEPDEVMVDAVAHAVGALDLSMRAMPDEHRLTIVTLATLAYTYGQNATALRLSAWWNRVGDEECPAEIEHGEFIEGIADADITTDHNFEVEPVFHDWCDDEIEKMRQGKRPFPPLPSTDTEAP